LDTLREFGIILILDEYRVCKDKGLENSNSEI
jgi:hypothetical protein